MPKPHICIIHLEPKDILRKSYFSKYIYGKYISLISDLLICLCISLETGNPPDIKVFIYHISIKCDTFLFISLGMNNSPIYKYNIDPCPRGGCHYYMMLNSSLETLPSPYSFPYRTHGLTCLTLKYWHTPSTLEDIICQEHFFLSEYVTKSVLSFHFI